MAKILIIRLTSLGDVIFTLPLVNALKNKGHDVSFLVAEKGLGVIKNNPSISKVHFAPLAKWRKHPFSVQTFFDKMRVISELRSEYYDIALDCQQMFKSLFLFKFCGAKRRITFSDARELSNLGGNEFVTPKAKFRDYTYHIVERNLDFARYLGIEPTNIQFSLPETSVEAKNSITALTLAAAKNKPIVVMSPATTWENKHWAEENWAQVIDGIYSKCTIVFTGTEKDSEFISRIIKETNNYVNYINLAGKTNLEELIELYSRAKVVVSPDSGSAHLAWASGNPAVVTIFTCTPAKRFGPYGDDSKYFTVQESLPCQPCFKKKCMLVKQRNICQYYPSASEITDIVNNLL